MQPPILKNINKLRQITSASILECKKAIIISKGNIKLGINYLINKSNYKDIKLITNKLQINLILCRRNKQKNKVIAIILSTENYFVTKNDLFKKLSNFILEVACLCKTKDEILKYKINKNLSLFKIINYFSKSIIQEPIELKTFVVITTSFINFYIHHNFNKAALIGFSNYIPGIEYISKYMAMQLVAQETPDTPDTPETHDKKDTHDKKETHDKKDHHDKKEKKRQKSVLNKIRKVFKLNCLNYKII
jgi:elongation factor Ts